MIRINNLCKKYDLDKLVLNDINLEIPNNQIIGILGVNGVGKSTLLKLCCKLIAPTGGEIIFDDVSDRNFYDDVVFISEEGTFFENLDVQENGAFMSSLVKRFDIEKYNKLIDYFDLDKFKKARNLSRGEKSKLELALGFCKGGKYLFLDEPFLGADIFARRDFLKIMISTLKTDETIIITTHQVEEMQAFLDRAIIIGGNRILKDIDMATMNTDNTSLKDEFISCYKDIRSIEKALKL